MAMTLATLGNGAGFVYITAADGVSIISNIENDPQVRQSVQKFVNTSASLIDPTLETDADYGYRIFGNTGGSAGTLVGASELTRFLVNRGSQAAAYKKSVTISTGIITLNRVANDTTLYVSTEGGLADQLDTITMAGVVDNDTVTIVGANSGGGGIITVPDATGNIFLSSSTSFTSGVRGVALVLRYFSAATAGWYEVSRNAIYPTTNTSRLAGTSQPVQGVNTTAMATSGTTTYQPGVDIGYQVITGSPVLIGSVVFATGGSPIDGDQFTVDYRATPTLGGNTVTIFGITLTTAQANQKVVVTTKYRTANTTWYTSISSNTNGVDYATGTQLATKQNTLPASGGDTFVLQKTILGALSFVPQVANNAWDLLGNSGTTDITNFIGTTDNIPLTIKVNNQKSGRIDNTLNNTFFGYQAGEITTGSDNIAIGTIALKLNIGGSNNVAVGGGYSNTTGSYNTGIGLGSIYSNTTGSDNTSIGASALSSNISGDFNTALGYSADVGSGALTNATAIGANAVVNTSNSVVIGSGSRVGIGTSSPNASSILDLTSTTGALLLPRMTTAQKNLLTPTNGMLVYDSTLNKFQGYENGAWTSLI